MNIKSRIKEYFESYGRHYDWHKMGTGIPVLEKLRCFECRLIHGVNPEYYVAMELYKKRHAEIRKYMGTVQSRKITRKMLKNSDLEEHRSVGNKLCFDEFYGALIDKIEITRGVKAFVPSETEPLDVLFYGIDILGVLL